MGWYAGGLEKEKEREFGGKDLELPNKQQMKGEKSHELNIEKLFSREKTEVRGRKAEWLGKRQIRSRGKEKKKVRHSWSSAWKGSMREAIQS